MPQSPERPYSLLTAKGRIRIFGGDGEEGNEGGAAGDGNEGGSEQELTEEQKALKEAQEKADAAEKRAKDAEKKAKDADKALQDKEREGMEEHDKLVAEHGDLQEKYDKLLKLVETSVIDSAISKLSSAKDKNGNPKYNWQSTDTVRALLDRGQIDIDLDTQEVTGLDSQLKDIAGKHPYLLVQQQEGDGKGTPPPPPGGPATGGAPGGGTTRQRETDRGKLGSKYKLPGYVGSALNIGAQQ